MMSIGLPGDNYALSMDVRLVDAAFWPDHDVEVNGEKVEICPIYRDHSLVFAKIYSKY